MRVHATKTNLTGAPSPAAGRCAIDTTGAGNEQVVRFAVDRSSTCMHACMQPPRGEQRTTTTERAGRRAGGHGRTPGDRRGSQQYQYFTAASYAYDHGAGPWMQWTGHRTAMHHACMAQWCSRLPVYHGNSDTMMAGRGYVRCLHTRTRGGRGAGSGRVIRPRSHMRSAGRQDSGVRLHRRPRPAI